MTAHKTTHKTAHKNPHACVPLMAARRRPGPGGLFLLFLALTAAGSGWASSRRHGNCRWRLTCGRRKMAGEAGSAYCLRKNLSARGR
jgi:hypothetical protein